MLTIKAASRRWLGQRGVQAISVEQVQGRPVLVFFTIDGRRPQGLPNQYLGYPVAVRRGGPFIAESRPAGPWSLPGDTAMLNPSTPSESEPWYRSPTYQKVLIGATVARLIASPIAMAVSYNRNKSVFWAVLQGVFIPVPYLVYTSLFASGKKS